ncbi:MAG: PAS domain S-box protein, partial [Armatimonadetes bacterium]|nr:PAS domain S-box protein [Armatimonadota bacterium]
MNIVLSLTVIIPSFGIISMMVISKSGELGFHLYYAGIMVIILIASTFFKLKLWNFMLSCLIILCIYGFAAIYFQDFLVGGFKGKDFPLLLSNILFLFSVMIISSVITFMFELDLRKEFIQEKTIKEEKEKLKKSEERNRIILENLGEGVTIIDFDENFVFAKPAAEILFGVESGGLVGKKLGDFLSEKNVQKILEETENRKRKITSTSELEIKRSDGEKHLVLITATPYYDNFNRVKGALAIFRDITERKQAEEKIKAKNIFLESLIQQSPLPTFVMDSKGFVLIVNEAFLKFYAVPNKEMVLGRNALTEPANVRQGVIKYFREALSGKIVEMPEMEFVSPYKNKKVITRCRLFPILDPTGTLTNVVVMQEDFTERKKMENKIKDSEIRYHDLFENSSEFLFTLDLKGNFTDVNNAAQVLTGYKKSELVKMNFKDYTPKRDHRKLFHVLYNIYKTGKPFQNFPVEAIIKDKSIKYFETSFSLMRKGEQIIGFQGSSKDVTERKQAMEKIRESEEKYRSLTETVADVIFTSNLKGKFTFLSSAFEKITGYRTQDYVGHHFKNILVPKYIDSTLNRFKRGIAGEEIPLYEIELLHKEKGTVSVELSVTSLYDKNGKIAGRIGSLRDITERKNSDQELKNAYSELENTHQELIQSQTLAALGELSSGIAHEIRNPLANISALAQFSIKNYTIDKPIKKNLRSIIRS